MVPRWPKVSFHPRSGERACERADHQRLRRPAAGMQELGLSVEVLDEDALAKLGMRALLGVGQGSGQPVEGRRHALERRQADEAPWR